MDKTSEYVLPESPPPFRAAPTRTGDPANDPSRASHGAEQRNERPLVLFFDTRQLTREGIAHSLAKHAPEYRILPLSDPAAALEEGINGDAGLILLNIGAGRIDDEAVLDTVGLMNQRLPDVPIIVLSEHEDIESIVQALEHGLRGYLPLSLPSRVIVEAMRLIRAGGTFVPASAILPLARQFTRTKAPAAGMADTRGLTPREAEVLARLQQGKANKVIARELRMEESTVKVHVRHIMQKMAAANRTEVAFRSFQRNADQSGADKTPVGTPVLDEN
jgi:DNA-binding NarL/FixJ family response regulator